METLIFIFGSLILTVVLFFFIGLYIAASVSKKKSKRKLTEIYEASPYRDNKDNKKQQNKNSDEFQARDERKEIVTGKTVSQAYEKHMQKEEKYQEGLVAVEKEKGLQKDDTVIVDIAKPVGFWSRLIMSQKLGFLMGLHQQMNKNNKHGYFVNLIRAQAKSQGKDKGRGM